MKKDQKASTIIHSRKFRNFGSKKFRRKVDIFMSKKEYRKMEVRFSVGLHGGTPWPQKGFKKMENSILLN